MTTNWLLMIDKPMNQSLTFVIFATGQETAQNLRVALSSDRRARVLAVSDDIEQVYADVVRWRPSAVIVTLGATPGQAWSLCERITAVCPETIIICASRNPSPELILASLRAGAREFLRLPIIAEEFKTVIDRTSEFTASKSTSSKKRGRVISVFASKGGCGTSFLAANLAVALQAPAVIVDLNLQAGDLDIFFGIKPKFSIADLVVNRARLDEGLLASYLAPHSSDVAVLPAPRNADAAEDIRPEPLMEVIQVLRENHDYVVLDLPHTFDANTLAALDNADDVMLVLTLDILAVRSAQRALTIFDRLGYSRSKIKTVINKWSKQSNLELRHVERYLGEKISAFITNDYAGVINSINLGQPLAGGSINSPVVAEIKRLATAYGASSPEQAEMPTEKKGLLSKLLPSRFRLGSGSSSGSGASANGKVTVMPRANQRALPAALPPGPAEEPQMQFRA
jgi:pilus assembly protein CpaE